MVTEKKPPVKTIIEERDDWLFAGKKDQSFIAAFWKSNLEDFERHTSAINLGMFFEFTRETCFASRRIFFQIRVPVFSNHC